MQASDLIQECANGMNDPSFNVFSPQEWIDLINFQTSALFPEITVENTYEIDVSTISNSIIDLSTATYVNVEDIKSVYLQDTNGNKIEYDNWIYSKTLSQLDLSPLSKDVPDYDPSDYDKVIILTHEKVPTIVDDSTDISLTVAQLNVLKRICIKEALTRVLLDQTKLDRYRTLVGRTNEYALLGIIRDLTLQIERDKSKLINTNPVRSF